MNYQTHLTSADSLVTPYAQVRAGFISMALEKNRKATPFVEEAKALKVLAAQANRAMQLLDMVALRPSLLTAAGISNKAANHLTENDKTEAIRGLIDNFLEPAGVDFVDELVYRFLLTRGDALGGSMRNLAGILAGQKLSRTIIATLSVQGKTFSWLDGRSRQWFPGKNQDTDLGNTLRGLHWQNQSGNRILVFNLTVPLVQKNVDLCLFDSAPAHFQSGKHQSSCHYQPDKYIALGELKGGIDPAGADEHWKTANSALQRVRTAFAGKNLSPQTFFIGAAIQKAMAVEIYHQLETGSLTNAANLTIDEQLVSICHWLITL